MTPYYQDDAVTIYHGDCRDVLPQLHAADLVLTSPPYGQLREYGGHSFDYESVVDSVSSFVRIGNTLVWVVGDQSLNGDESGDSFRQALRFKSNGLALWDTMIYEKNGPAYPSKGRYFQIFEFMFVFTKGEPTTINLINDRPNRWAGLKWSNTRTRRAKNGELKRQDWWINQDSEFGVRFNIWRYNNGAGYSAESELAYDHPAIFPIKLASDHIRTWTNPNDIVCDPMCGSGTTLRAAKDSGRRAIGVDVEERYCEIAAKRMAQEVLPLNDACPIENEVDTLALFT